MHKLQVLEKLLQTIYLLILNYQKQLLKMGRLLGPLLKTGLPLKKNLLKPLPKRILIPL